MSESTLELPSDAPEFFPSHLTEASGTSVSSDDGETLREENLTEDFSNVHHALDHDFGLSNKDLLSADSKQNKPKLSWQEKEKWSQSNESSVSVIAGKSKKGSSQKKFESKSFKNKEPRIGCSRHMTGTQELLSSYVNKEGSSVAFGGN
ncbi:hypothetical protein OSB04_016824 [Centaurea solstitialis]|uniref:Uncharacterized protein n=1 Tax=Centaurea solstitialis TaxID=347529 RepID=A0AA38T1R2_9ASTR|nr:hypothetical protein OSB04_016824 [Centaurea solstitialis]